MAWPRSDKCGKRTNNHSLRMTSSSVLSLQGRACHCHKPFAFTVTTAIHNCRTGNNSRLDVAGGDEAGQLVGLVLAAVALRTCAESE